MIKNKEQYVIVKERQSQDVITLTFTKKERKCDTCLCMKKARDITVVKYPIINKYLGRVIMTKQVCTDCYSSVKEIIDNLKYN
tara:strand:- start:102 stop:350 length:249 start_codon:yes stop_codon:yes gene_type:complete